jgi:2-polyprenyl-6-methoxyphenol hydroxylase-like FAD-dependent oxidoreductase
VVRGRAGTHSDPCDVLVVGAGPTGLALALQAHDHGAHVAVLERRPDQWRPSRALIVHPRTLEVLRPHGVTDALLARGDTAPRAQLHLGRHTVPVGLDRLDLGGTAFPHLVLVRQADVEDVLARALADRGVVVQRGTAVCGVRSEGDQATATVRRDGREDRIRARYVVGCDGSASTIRAGADIAWKGHAYRHDVLLADVELDGDLAPDVLHAVAGRAGLVFLFPLGERATWRLLATAPARPPGQPAPVPMVELQQLVDDAGLSATITDVAWSDRMHLEHRLAGRYRRGNVLLAGDAAHTCSPAGGQGMNTGIQDVANLGWKLAFAAHVPPGHDELLLQSYEAERRPVARAVLALSRTVFWGEAGTDPVATFVRGVVAPMAAPLVPFVQGRRRLVAEGAAVLSQLRWHYRRSPLSCAATHRWRSGTWAGDRLPDQVVDVDRRRAVRLHELTSCPGVHVLLARDTPDPWLRTTELVHVHRVTSWPGAGVLVVRPDGHVGLRSERCIPEQVTRWLQLACVPVVSGRTALEQPAEGSRPDPVGLP